MPAVEAFQRILGAIEEGDVEVEDEAASMRDLAYLSTARTFAHSASVTVDETTNAPDRRPGRRL